MRLGLPPAGKRRATPMQKSEDSVRIHDEGKVPCPIPGMLSEPAVAPIAAAPRFSEVLSGS